MDAKTHPYISTGLKNNKFGVAYDKTVALYKHAASLSGIRISGIDMHIGSQITELEPFVHAADKIFDIVDALKAAGLDELLPYSERSSSDGEVPRGGRLRAGRRARLRRSADLF